MHRATPVNSSFRGYTAGGARSIIDQVDDKKLMQEMAGNFMKGETRQSVECPQNFGFTSVCADGDKDKDGNLTMGPEAFISFMGGNRSFPVCSVMDDRRHRLKGLDKGSVGMFGLKEWGQQFLLHKDGMTMSGNTGKNIRLQLVDNKNAQQQQQQPQQPQPQVSQHADGGNGAGGAAPQQQQGQQKATGQETLHQQSSNAYFDIQGKVTENVNTEHKIMLDDKETSVQMKDGKVYLGGLIDKHKFSKVMTEDGPSKNVFARIA